MGNRVTNERGKYRSDFRSRWFDRRRDRKNIFRDYAKRINVEHLPIIIGFVYAVVLVGFVLIVSNKEHEHPHTHPWEEPKFMPNMSALPAPVDLDKTLDNTVN